MEFGHVEDIEAVKKIDFSFPHEDPRNAQVLVNAVGGAPRIFVGAPNWTEPKWAGKIIPAKTPKKDFLKHFSRQFSAIELNATFYRVPDEAGLRAWRDLTPPGFKFCPKFPSTVTHRRWSEETPREIETFCTRIRSLGEWLGTSFLQFPETFQIRGLPDLKKILSEIPESFPVFAEFRHGSWFDRQKLIPEVFELLRERNIGTIITDTSGRRDVLHSTLTDRRAFVRFLGNDLHASDFTRIDTWVLRLTDWVKRGLKEIYFMPHHHTYENVPELANDFIVKMNRSLGLALPEIRFLSQSSQAGRSQGSLLASASQLEF
ncbi:MAG: DUF72 domain-containing protein [Spirochaetia bacterium]|nr:DUF72 domain-containing protein [Spirochaetia bacterium]